MNSFKKDILLAITFTTGLFGYISGEFIVSSTLFAIVAIASDVNKTTHLENAG